MKQERVTLAFDADSFAGRLCLVDEAARRLNKEWALREATWEPHDWGFFTQQ